MSKFISISIGFAGLIHLVLAPQHFEHAPAHGIFFVIAGISEGTVKSRRQSMSKRKPNPKFHLVLAISGGVLLVITAILIGLQNTSNATPQTSAPQLGGEDTYPEIQRVRLEDSKTAYDAGSAVFVDVRAVDSYNISHIPGALNIPLANTPERLGKLDKAKWIFTYCT